MREISFMAACKEFFGTLPDQTTLQFAAEVRKLTAADREEMIPGLEKELNCKIKA